MKKLFLLVLCLLLSGACNLNHADSAASISFSVIPEAGRGGAGRVDVIAGSVSGAREGQRIILYAHSGSWWIQPFVKNPYTDIQPDLTWKNSTHLGTEYAALLVEPGYQPPAKMNELPNLGNGVAAVATVEGTPAAPAVQQKIQFSGYEWNIRSTPNNPGGTLNLYDPANAWTDNKGFLHLKIAQSAGQWTSAEIILSRSLGYGTYKFTVEDTSALEPAAVLSMYTWGDSEADQNHRQMNIDLSRWGAPDNKNLQYVIQPYYVPANAVRFNAPAGLLTHILRWEPDRAEFRSVQTPAAGKSAQTAAEHIFVSGVPTPEDELIHLNLFVFGYAKTPLRKDNEVVIEKFEYLP